MVKSNVCLVILSIDVNIDFVGSSSLLHDVNLFPKFVVTLGDGGEAIGHGVESCHLMRIGAKGGPKHTLNEGPAHFAYVNIVAIISLKTVYTTFFVVEDSVLKADQEIAKRNEVIVGGSKTKGEQSPLGQVPYLQTSQAPF